MNKLKRLSVKNKKALLADNTQTSDISMDVDRIPIHEDKLNLLKSVESLSIHDNPKFD